MVSTVTTAQQGDRTEAMRFVRGEQLLLIGILLAGFSLRLVMLDRYPFHQDEAIYSYWALYGRHVDPLFLHVWPDKPPIFLWLLGGSFDLFGATPMAARLLNVAFSTITILAVSALARGWWGMRAGVIAALLMALSPFAISFAPTAFTDPLMVMAGVLALYAVHRRRYVWAGLWLGVAVMTKQQGLLFAPLVVMFAFLHPLHPGRRVLAILQFLAGILLVVAPVLYWDSLRWAVAPSPWDLGARNAAGFALSSPHLWLARLGEWSSVGGYLLGEPWLWAIAGGVVLVWRWMHRRAAAPFPLRAPAILLALWSLAFFALHVVTTVQIWDRYLLPLAAPVALLGALGAEWAFKQESAGALNGAPRGIGTLMRGTPALTVSIFLLLLTGPAWQAAQGRIPVGGDHGAYTGIEEVSNWLEDHAGETPILYHRNLGWHIRFYLFDAVEAGHIDLRWFPSDVYLADNAAKTPHRPRYLVVAEWSPERDLAMQLAMHRLTAVERLRVGHFALYEITEQTPPPAYWRVCREAGGGASHWPIVDVPVEERSRLCTERPRP